MADKLVLAIGLILPHMDLSLGPLACLQDIVMGFVQKE